MTHTDQRRATRRGVLRAAGVAGASALAGCLSTVDIGGTSETVGVELHNGDDERRRLSVRVTFDGASLLERSVTLGPGDDATGAFENPETTGDARVVADLADGVSTEAAVRVGPGTGIRSVTVRIPDSGGLSVYSGRT